MKFLYFLDILSEIIQLVFEFGLFTRKYIVPAVVYTYVVIEHYVFPAVKIPYYYLQVRKERLSLQGVTSSSHSEPTDAQLRAMDDAIKLSESTELDESELDALFG